MSLAPWRSSLARSLHRNRSLVYARYLQLATVRADHRPANRTVVFRGFLHDTNQLKFVTDARSEKAEQIDQCPWAEVCWYFPTTREQFRITGSLALVGKRETDSILKEARQQMWQELSDSARSQFVWPHPGKPRTNDEGFDSPAPDRTEPPSQFCLLLLDPNRVDHLELRGNPQNRWLYQLEGQTWSTQAVNP